MSSLGNAISADTVVADNIHHGSHVPLRSSQAKRDRIARLQHTNNR